MYAGVRHGVLGKIGRGQRCLIPGVKGWSVDSPPPVFLRDFLSQSFRFRRVVEMGVDRVDSRTAQDLLYVGLLN